MADSDNGSNVFELKTNKKGQRNGGRKTGVPNKTTQILKDALLDAARRRPDGLSGMAQYDRSYEQPFCSNMD